MGAVGEIIAPVMKMYEQPARPTKAHLREDLVYLDNGPGLKEHELESPLANFVQRYMYCIFMSSAVCVCSCTYQDEGDSTTEGGDPSMLIHWSF